MPEEDEGYFLINVQLPDAASLQRSDAVQKHRDDRLTDTEGVEYVTTIAGYSLLTGFASASNTGFLFVSLDDRGTSAEAGGARQRDHRAR